MMGTVTKIRWMNPYSCFFIDVEYQGANVAMTAEDRRPSATQ